MIIETGSGAGRLTRRLLGDRAHVHAVDPAPAFDPTVLTKSGLGSLTLHRARSLDVLGELQPCDLAVLDGDPNWYTVRHELGLLVDGARHAGADPPVVVVHHTDWPFGRRDGYFDAASIPEFMRSQHEAAGLLPWSADPRTDGLRMVPEVASAEGQPQNGVMTAVEDFLLADSGTWTMVELPGLHGVVVLAPSERLAASASLAPVLASFTRPRFLNGQIHRVEREWIRELIDARHIAEVKPAERVDAPSAPAEEQGQRQELPARQPNPAELAAEYERGLGAGEQMLAQARLQAAVEQRDWLVGAEREKAELARQGADAQHAAAMQAAERANEIRERSQAEREVLLRTSIESELRLEIAARDLGVAGRDAEVLRDRISELERQQTELSERLRSAEAHAIMSADEARLLGARASHYAELLEAARAETQRLEVRLEGLQVAYVAIEQERRLTAGMLDRGTQRLGWRVARRISVFARRMTFRGGAPSHPIEQARAGLRRQLDHETGLRHGAELDQGGVGDADLLATRSRA